MPTAVADTDLDTLLKVETLSRETINYIKEQVFSSKETREDLDAKIASLRIGIKKVHDVNEAKDLTLLLGILEWMIGNVKEASEFLKEVKSRKIAAYYLGKCYQELGDYDHALECFERAKKTDTEEFDICMDIAETKRLKGNNEDALKIVKSFSHSHENNPDFHYQLGCCLDALGEYDDAHSHYEQSLRIAPNYAKSLFRMAFNYDLGGEDEKAIEYYEQCIKLCPNHKNAFINLGILYEDEGSFDDAVYCYETVLEAEQNNPRALLFLKDAKDSMGMYYDEEISKKQGKESEVLNIPISDFELSVRSKNCLERMNIRTLRDLTRITEVDLLSFKNFGETSLNEIKFILSQKGLRLGQAVESDSETEGFGNDHTERKTGIIQTISELGLSTRCRNALIKVGIETIKDLTEKTEIELDQKGIKQNYIDEICDRLSEVGLVLKNVDNGKSDLDGTVTE
ncbi:MAG: tetratricopeptide repeat protein [Planctomycetia bacterium]|nr:tetratricopeptide repeat protein [Candidatus Brocadia sp.]QOJ07569.1 MAG: tetratricopeptide repeat protein [Planctomycetia bacterium]HQU30258.1 DNA-directed RNA polymerase subunit alpha C-terminal domain-containing protein [Candidatus Brocadia sapporoensis]